jgi:hypothetical protein
MQNTKKKLSYVINALKFFGIILESFNEPQNKRLKFLKYWPLAFAVLYAIYVLILTTLMVKMFLFDGGFNIRTDYVGILLIICLHLRGIIDVIYIVYRRKTEEKFWNLLDQLDDFIERFLGIKINYQMENRKHLIESTLIFIMYMTFGFAMGVVNYTLTEKFSSHYGKASFMNMIHLLNLIRYVFYVSILHYRLKALIENFDEIKLHDYKLQTLQHIYSIIWKLSKVLENRFTIPLIFLTTHCFMTLIFFGYVIARSIQLNLFNELYVASLIMPQVPIWIVCFYCHRISIDVII